MGAGASTLHGDADPAAVAAAMRGFKPMDAAMVEVIRAGHLRLLKAAVKKEEARQAKAEATQQARAAEKAKADSLFGKKGAPPAGGKEEL